MFDEMEYGKPVIGMMDCIMDFAFETLDSINDIRIIYDYISELTTEFDNIGDCVLALNKYLDVLIELYKD